MFSHLQTSQVSPVPACLNIEGSQPSLRSAIVSWLAVWEPSRPPHKVIIELKSARDLVEDMW